MLLIVLAAVTAARPGAELVLVDGTVVEGSEVRREGGVYVVTTTDGRGVVTLPAELVREVRVGEAPPAPPPARDPATGLTPSSPEVLAGVEIEPPRTQDQLAVLGEPARFQRSPIDPTWHPTDAFAYQGDVLADSRSTWQESPIDPTWHPTDAFAGQGDVLAAGRSTFAKSPIDSSWTPKDGFAKD